MKCCCGNVNAGAAFTMIIAVGASTFLSIAGQPAKKEATQPTAVSPAKKAEKPAAVQPAVNTLTDAEKKEGWVLLFDGKSLEHFKGFKSDAVPTTWNVDGDAVHATGGGADLVTKDQYQDFEFSCEWKLAPGGNSGIIYRSTEDGNATYETGPEFQVLDNNAHKDAKPVNKAGAMYDFFPAAKDMTKPAGEWNTARIVVKGTKVEHWWNGEKVVDADIGTEAFKKAVHATKFKDWKGFAVQPKGHIALQDHGDQVWYRNIKVRVIK